MWPAARTCDRPGSPGLCRPRATPPTPTRDKPNDAFLLEPLPGVRSRRSWWCPGALKDQPRHPWENSGVLGALAKHEAGWGSPSLELVGQLVQDLHGLPVVVQLGIHQRGQLAHLLDLQRGRPLKGRLSL